MGTSSDKPASASGGLGLRRNGFSFDSLTGLFGTSNQAAAVLDFAAEQTDHDWSYSADTGVGLQIPSLGTQISAFQGADASNESVASCASVASVASLSSDVGPTVNTSTRRRRVSAPAKVTEGCTDVTQHASGDQRHLLRVTDYNKKHMMNWLYGPKHMLSGGISEEPGDEGLAPMSPTVNDSATPIIDAVKHTAISTPITDAVKQSGP